MLAWFDVVQSHPQTTPPVRDEAARLRQHWPEMPARRGDSTTLAQALAELRPFLKGKGASADT